MEVRKRRARKHRGQFLLFSDKNSFLENQLDESFDFELEKKLTEFSVSGSLKCLFLSSSIENVESPKMSFQQLDYLLQTNRLCHSLLKEHLHSLADFEDLFQEVKFKYQQIRKSTK